VRVAGKNRVDARDEGVKLLHEVAKEFARVLDGDFSLVGDQAFFELDLRFHGVHLRRIAEGENAPEMLLADGGSDLSG
jgi:hypothetical protein